MLWRLMKPVYSSMYLALLCAISFYLLQYQDYVPDVDIYNSVGEAAFDWYR